MSVNAINLHLHIREGDLTITTETKHALAKIEMDGHAVFLHDQETVETLQEESLKMKGKFNEKD